MHTILLDDEVRVERKGYTPDAQGSRYCVIDYINSDAGRSAAHAMAVACMSRERAYADALLASLSGEPEEPVLLTYTIETDLDVHPDARFIVCNVTRHFPSRVAAQRYGMKARDHDPETAERVLDFVADTGHEFSEYVKEKVRSQKNQKKRKGRR